MAPLKRGSKKKEIKKKNLFNSHENRRKSKVHKMQRPADQAPECSAMNSTAVWVANYTAAATSHLRLQVAYWKARAESLEYENSKLQEVIRTTINAGPSTSKVNASDRKSEQSDSSTEDSEQSSSESEQTDADNNETQQKSDSDELEVSEEYIQFLIGNAKYREDAKRERERLRAKQEEESLITAPEPESDEDYILRKKKLYGDKYQRIVALETYLTDEFQKQLETEKPAYWPNIPFNFNFKSS